MTVSDTPVVLVGASCRLPSVNGLTDFWDVLSGGRCVISEVDETRFATDLFRFPDRSAPGRAVTFAAGQLARPYDFDPTYFGISPREAEVMDPQQRVLLEVAAEALHHAGIPAASLAGDSVGVYVGASSLDYSTSAELDPASVQPQSMLGNTLSIIANRISYVFDLKGPSYVVDTACSSSLIALHNALEDIRAERIDTAIVGGVSMLFHLIPFIGFSRAQMLSATGLCRAFDKAADGYVRSEGAVALVLRSQAAARSGDNPARAHFVSSGINSDGRTSGLSLPAMAAQSALLRKVYAAAGLDPNRLAFIEAHGTGTPVGDPVEAEAIGTVLGEQREAPLLIGSSKTNFGHLEPASGLVGVLKAQQALEHNVLPASLHVTDPNPHIPFSAWNLQLATEATALPREKGPRLAGINSFGFGGANAHVVLEDAPVAAERAVDARDAPLIISAASSEALRALAARYAERLQTGSPSVIVNAAAHRRDRLSHRAVVAPGTEMATALRVFADGADDPRVTVGEAVTMAERPVFAYAGNGSQYAGMGQAAYRGEAAFRDSFDRTDRAFMSVAGWSLLSLLFSSDLESEIERTEVAQPLLFALQVALTEALAERGLTPSAVMGHSVGEVAAAWACGALSLNDAVKVIHARSTHQEMTRHLGGMAALLLPAEEAKAALADHPGMELAAVNSPRSVTVSGPTETLAAFAKEARKNRWAMKRLPLDYPFHCALVDPIREPLLASLCDIAPRSAAIPFISTVTGAAMAGEQLGPDYWWQNVRCPVRFADAVTNALHGNTLFVEVGPRPLLATYVNDVARQAERRVAVIPTLAHDDARSEPSAAIVRDALSRGAAVDDARVFGARCASPDVLPAYPWQHKHFRIERSIEEVRLSRCADHAFLGQRLTIDRHDWRSFIDTARLPFLADHKVDDTVVFPGAAFVEMLLAAGRIVDPGTDIEVSNLDIVAPMVLEDCAQREVRTHEIAPRTFVIQSRPRLSPEGWQIHAKGTVSRSPAAPTVAPQPTPCGRVMDADTLYATTEKFGLPYGPAFRKAARVALSEHGAVVDLLAPDEDVARRGFALDPTLFDACFHALFAFIGEAEGGVALLPVRVGRIRLAAHAGTPVTATLAVRRPADDVAEADFSLFSEDGHVVAVAKDVRFQAVPLATERTPILVAEPQLRRLGRMRDPAAQLPDLVAALTADPMEPSEAALIVDAGVQAAAFSVLMPLFDPPSTLDALTAAGRLHGSARPLVSRLLLALEASGLAEEADEVWTLADQGMDIADAVALLVSEHPERLAEAAAIAAMPCRFGRAIASGLLDDGPLVSDPLLAQLLTDAPTSRALFDALVAAIEAAGRGAAKAGLSIAVIGAGNITFIRKVARVIDPSHMELVVTDRDAGVGERAALVMERSPGISIVPFDVMGVDGHTFDLVCLAPTLAAPDLSGVADLLKPGGSVIGAAHVPSLFADAVAGLSSRWWAATADPDSPVGALADAAEWADILTAEGLEAATAAPVASGECDAVLFSARRSLQPVSIPFTMPALHAYGERARRMVDALSAMAEGDVRPSDLSNTPDGNVLVALSAERQDELAPLLARLGAFLAALGTGPRSVTLVTFGAHGVAARDVSPTAAALAAFCRTSSNEMPHLDIRMVDITPTFDASEAAVRLCRELEQPNTEREIALSSDHRAAVRYVPVQRNASAGAVSLSIPRRGSIDHLHWRDAALPPLGANEVRLKVEAVGLNFRDVMWTLGLLPHEALQDGYAGPTLGMECAGVVHEVGSQVTTVTPGDAVIAFAPASFASHVTVRADAVVRRPTDLTADAAATIPVAFLTAYYALMELGRLEPEETVLIHGGAGGVGLAALQIAKAQGARVFATAGTEEKRALLALLGADHVFDSRSLTFADGVKAVSGGEGVDVVLNSLAGEAMERSLDCLKPFGRFLELGKRDFYADTKLGLRPFRQNLSYFGIDADQLMKHRPRVAERILTTLMAAFEDGTFTPLPYRAFPATSVHDAFRLMQTAGHIGKIVVTAPPVVAASPAEPTTIDPDGTYLLVGGTSGFGFATAQWLIGEGARHLILVSRSGVKDESVSKAIEQHRADGVSVIVAQADVTDAAQMKALVDSVTERHPLTGVFHMAMVLDDALIGGLDEVRFERVLAPKAAGVEALETALGDTPLTAFVLYSSITVQLGNPGQANYVAANAYLEGVARRRRAAGKPALAVAWGAIGDVGVLSRDNGTSQLLQRKLGRYAISAAEGLHELKSLLSSGAMTSGSPIRLIGRVDWSAAAKDLALARSPAFIDLADRNAGEEDSAGAVELAERLKGLSEPEAISEICRLLAAEISRILKMPIAEVDVQKPLTALGMDSLMGVELRMAAEQRLGIDVPLMSLASGATLTDLAKKVVARGQPSAGGDKAADMLIAQHVDGEVRRDEDLADLTSAVEQKASSMRTFTQ